MIFFFLKHIVKLCVAWRIIIIMVMQIYSTYGIALVSMTIAADKVHMSILCMPVYRCACVTYRTSLESFDRLLESFEKDELVHWLV